MKKFLIIYFGLLLPAISLMALGPVSAYTTDGYYRVQNYGSERYAYVSDNTDNSDIARNVFDLAALQLWKDLNRTISDPASIIYIEQHGTDNYDLRAQGTGVYSMVGMYVNVKPSSSPAYRNMGLYEVGATGTYAGVTATKYLSDGEQSEVADGTMSVNGTGKYRQWAVFQVSATDDTNYFGITPSVTVGDKHYYPFYAAFPFSFHSSGMKAYTITKVDAAMRMAVLSEVVGDVPANTPVLIECSSTEATNNRLNLLASSFAAPTDNLLRGVYFCNNKRPKSQDALTQFDASTMRVLGTMSDGRLGFVTQSSSNLKTFPKKEGSYIPANQAYLSVAAGTPEELRIVTEAEYQEALSNIEYTITYQVDGKVYATQTYKVGAEIVAPEDPQKEGYTFAEWEALPETMPEYDFVVKGSFTVNSYSLTYLVDNNVYQQFMVDYGEEIVPIENPLREGYIFSGWNNVPATMPAHDVEIHGSFTVDAIRDIVVDGKHVVFSLTGMRIPMSAVRKGIYIIDGKKVILK